VVDGGGPAIQATEHAGRVIPDDVWGPLCIFAESRSEPYEGQVAVGCVIRNRMARRFFSDGTVVGTVTAPHQFSWMNTSDAQRTRVLRAEQGDPAWRVAVKAWDESRMSRAVDDAVMYHADYVAPYWAKAQGIRLVKRIGRHLFYVDEKLR
jgi:spore germination cell wall hydrolase CwlJ-like protein